MAKTFGDYLRQQGGREPETVIPADECDIIDRFARVDSISREEEIKLLSNKLIETLPEGFDDGYILGEEAEFARCENCQVDMNRNDGVECNGCGGFFGRHGRGRAGCWTNHNCGVLVTSHGALVAIGDVLTYPNHSDEFEVIEMAGTWKKGGYARAKRKRGNHEMPIITRLMYHKETN